MGFELMTKLQKQAERFGARVKFGTVDSVDLSGQAAEARLSMAIRSRRRTLIISTGSSPREHRPRFRVCAGEAWRDLLRDLRRRAAAIPQPELVVVGGGDSAVEEATYLTRFASKVYLVHRRDSLRASHIMQERALNHPKIQMVWNSVVTEVTDVAAKKVTGVKLKNIVTGETSTLACAGLFVAIGHTPNVKVFGGQIELDAKGYIKLQGGQRTNVPGVFAAGDVADHVYRQAITAAGTGCAAAIEAERFWKRRRGRELNAARHLRR